MISYLFEELPDISSFLHLRVEFYLNGHNYCYNNRDNVISLVVKSLKNPRSAVCKTAIMTSADIVKAYGDHIVDSLDPLVCFFH